MNVIYILSGKLFGSNIYEINCTNNIDVRMLSDETGFPEANILHYSVKIDECDIMTCKQMMNESFFIYKMKKQHMFYKINLNDAKKQIDKIVFNLNYNNAYNLKKQEIMSKKKSCF